MHSRLVALVDIIGYEPLLMVEQFSELALLHELHAMGFLGQDASIIAVQVGEQAAPVIPEIIRNCLVILLKFFV